MNEVWIIIKLQHLNIRIAKQKEVVEIEISGVTCESSFD